MQEDINEQKLERRIIKRFRKALSTYHLIEDGDKILIGLSGGKDSLCLLEMLGRRAKIERPKFSVEAIHIRMENIRYESDTTYLQEFAARFDVPLHIVTTHFDERDGSRKPACFLCSWYRRKEMLNLAQQLGCNKIALGHHMDDLIHTAMMNIFSQGHFSTMPVSLRLRKMPLTIIRPLCTQAEADIRLYAEMKRYEKQLKQCPHERETNRTEMKHMFEEIEKTHPEARYSVWNALETDGKLVEDWETSNNPRCDNDMS